MSAPNGDRLCPRLEYKRGRISDFVEERSGRPKTATTDVRVDLVHQTVMEDRRLTVKVIAKACAISSKQRLITVDETWIYHHTPGTKQESL